ncbi:hypothetical protein K505DRAFT_339448 [Melanomma pulvis-pyrius CBS 109.77]|uniref:Uncharacterized protein n=1 Tax=Melanomma pulvis-pyrius CBS 109.77 TaxID=1314802 RepID=A0A6A6X5Q6_9PLEO|nr:hypothetical protein K505DRAFT_339448 [Melanomma pulvis-pyrius CBS 109.77]
MEGESIGYICPTVADDRTSVGIFSAYIRPFGATNSDALNEIYTSSPSGFTCVDLDDPPEDSSGKYNPLLNTVSEHTVGEGILQLKYQYSWYSEMEAIIQQGALAFDGSSLEETERGEEFVKAKRGPKGWSPVEGESWMEARVGTGDLDIHLGL